MSTNGFRTLTNLKKLDLSRNTAVVDTVVGDIAQACHLLRKLDLSSTKVTSVAVIAVSRLPLLRNLSLSNTLVDDKALYALTDAATTRRYENAERRRKSNSETKIKWSDAEEDNGPEQATPGLVHLSLVDVCIVSRNIMWMS